MYNENKIIELLVKTRKWDENNVILGIRADFKCEYCDRDLLASVNDYKEWQVDHIIPLSKGGADFNENKAVCCRTCNVNVKGKWNPATKVEGEKTRDTLINATREYVKVKRAELLAEVTYFNSVVHKNMLL